jgi:DNA primase
LASKAATSPEQRARMAETALAVINEHPNVNVRKLYAGQVASQLGLPIGDLVAMAERRTRAPQVTVASASRRRGPRENAEFVAITLLVQQWEEIAPWLIEELFADEVYRRAFLAIAAADGDVSRAVASADPEAREVIERAAVVDVEADAELEARNLIGAAVRRALATGLRSAQPERVQSDREARLQLEDLQTVESAQAASEWLLTWLIERKEAQPDGGH